MKGPGWDETTTHSSHLCKTNGCMRAFAMQPGSPLLPCIHSMHGVGCRLPEKELPTGPTASPVAMSIHIHIRMRGTRGVASQCWCM